MGLMRMGFMMTNQTLCEISIRFSIRANQHTETIQAQYAVLQQQKDDLSARLSEAEDRESKNKAALINLQCVLEQFQRGWKKLKFVSKPVPFVREGKNVECNFRFSIVFRQRERRGVHDKPNSTRIE